MVNNVVKMLDKRLIDLKVTANNEEELFEKIGSQLLELGFVNENYITGLKQRESKFPTGLITPFLNIALPHSDTEFIEIPFIYIVRLEEPVLVKQMGDSQDMKVRNVLFLGIKEPSKQVGLLSLLMTLFQDKDFVDTFTALNDNEEMFRLLKNKFMLVEED